MENVFKCPTCDAPMIRDVRPDVVTYKGEAAPMMQPGWYCTACDEIVLVGKDSAITEQTFIELKAKVDDILTPEEVQRIRKKLRVSQRTAGALLGGGPRAFQKYESGADWTSRPMANLLRLLDNDPERVEELAEHVPRLAASRRPPGGRKSGGLSA